LWETKQGHLELASIAGFGSGIPDISHTRRLAAFSAPNRPVGRADTPTRVVALLQLLNDGTASNCT
jgi:hypothetical protein